MTWGGAPVILFQFLSGSQKKKDKYNETYKHTNIYDDIVIRILRPYFEILSAG